MLAANWVHRMNGIALEITILLVLFLINGVFAMAEVAVVSSRKARLRRLSEQGDPSARAALELAESPNRFLSTVQVGITLVGIFAGAFGGASLTSQLAPWIARYPALAPHAQNIAFFVVVSALTYLSLVLGELVPKRVGLGNPEGIAMAVARPMQWLSRAAAPLVTLLSGSTDALLRLVGFKVRPDTVVTEDEVRVLMQEGVRAGAFNRVESHIVHQALEIDQILVREIMTPKPKVIGLNQDDSHELIWHKIVVSNHSHFPVYAGHRDRVVGIVSVKAIYANLAAGAGVTLRNLMIPPLVVPETQSVLQLVETFKERGKHIAMVTDEFGSIVGLVTLNDVMEAIVGRFPSLDERSKPTALQREDGTWLIDALLEIAAVERSLPGFKLEDSERSEYQTLAGFVMKRFGRVPREGESFQSQGYTFEVIDMDGHRVDKILVLPTGMTAPGLIKRP